MSEKKEWQKLLKDDMIIIVLTKSLFFLRENHSSSFNLIPRKKVKEFVEESRFMCLVRHRDENVERVINTRVDATGNNHPPC